MINDQNLYYTDSGGDGLPVLACHATMLDSVTLEPLTAKIAAAGYRVIAFDQRHHGQTISNGEPFTYSDLGDDLLGLADHLGIDKFALLGEGTGGIIGLLAAVSAPERFCAVILIGVSTHAPAHGEADAIKAVVRAWCRGGPHSEIYRRVAERATATPEDAADLVARWQATAWDEFGPFGEATASRTGFTEQLGVITCPALVINASEDIHCPVIVGRDVAEHLGGTTKFVPIKHKRHCLTFAFRPEVSDETVAWLASCSVPNAA